MPELSDGEITEFFRAAITDMDKARAEGWTIRCSGCGLDYTSECQCSPPPRADWVPPMVVHVFDEVPG